MRSWNYRGGSRGLIIGGGREEEESRPVCFESLPGHPDKLVHEMDSVGDGNREKVARQMRDYSRLNTPLQPNEHSRSWKAYRISPIVLLG